MYGLQVKQVELQMRVAEMLPCAVLGPLALEGLDTWLSDTDYASAGALLHVFSSAPHDHIGSYSYSYLCSSLSHFRN